MLQNLLRWYIQANYIYDIFNHSRGKRQIAESRAKGNIAYYSASNSNNGLTDFISTPKFIVNTEAIIYTTFGDAYYVNSNFSTSDEITILTSPKLNKYNALFICCSIQQNKSKYSFGRKAFSNKIEKDKILLPVDKNNNLDWNFMDNYIKELENNKIKKYEEYLINALKDIKYKKIFELNNKIWKSFFVTDIFPEIQRGKRLIKSKQIKGETPYISSTSLNNGVDNFVSNMHNVRRFSNCISIANSGSVGSSFYQPFEFVASDHVTHLKNENMNKYTYLFIATMTNRLSEKYNLLKAVQAEEI